MNVSHYVNISADNHVEGNAGTLQQRLDTRNPEHYGAIQFQGLCHFLVAHAYAPHQAQIADMLGLVSSTGTGERVLADLQALNSQGVRIAIGPRDDLGPDDSPVPLYGVSTTVDGCVLWDCYYGFGCAAVHSGPDAYKRLVWTLAQVRNLAAETAWPGVPPLLQKQVEPAFMAELALRTAPAIAYSQFVPSFPVRLHPPDPAYMPDWCRDAIGFDNLEGLMPAWFTDAGKHDRDELLVLLRTVEGTAIGQRLLADLWVYGRSRAVMLIHRSDKGTEGVHKLGEEDPIWSFDKAALARHARSGDLLDSEAQASGAFLRLLRIHDMLAVKLGMLTKVVDRAGMQVQFEHELIESRARRLIADPAHAPYRTPTSTSRDVERRVGAEPGQRRGAAVSSPLSAPRTASVPALPVAPATPVSTDPPPMATQALEDDSGMSLPVPYAPDARQHKGIARWLQDSARTLARTFNSSSSRPRVPVGRHNANNPYVGIPGRAGDLSRYSDA